MIKKNRIEEDIVVIAPTKQPLLPRFTYTQLLVVLLVIAAFAIGQLTAQIKDLQTGTTAVAAMPAQQNPAAAVSPTPGKVDVGVGSYAAQGNPNAKVKIVAFEDLRC